MKKITTFYTPNMSLPDDQINFSFSPQKPKRLIEYLTKHKLIRYFKLKDFEPLEREDLYIAHVRKWVDNFLDGTGKIAGKNIIGIKWSKDFAETVRYTNASLYHAIRHSVQNPDNISFSPTSGFHHATPKTGALFCSFSGQVIASMKIYREFGLSGCYIDLDGHYGNSIDSSYDFVTDLDKAIPKKIGNINILKRHGEYLEELTKRLAELRDNILNNTIHYLVFCHGADSHEWDDLGSQLTTEEWLYCSEMFYRFVDNINKELGRKIPLTISLFGGYRNDHFDSVLSLHTADLVYCLNILCGNKIRYNPRVIPVYYDFDD